MTTAKKPSTVFAHGLWADGSCFSKLIPALHAEGHQVMASQHGLDSLKSDVDCVTRCIGRVTPADSVPAGSSIPAPSRRAQALP
jgi:hypothetical protein